MLTVTIDITLLLTPECFQRNTNFRLFLRKFMWAAWINKKIEVNTLFNIAWYLVRIGNMFLELIGFLERRQTNSADIHLVFKRMTLQRVTRQAGLIRELFMALSAMHASRRLVFIQQVGVQHRIGFKSASAKQTNARACRVHCSIMIRPTSSAPKRSSTGKTPILSVFRVFVTNMVAQSYLRCTCLPTLQTKRFAFTTHCFVVIWKTY